MDREYTVSSTKKSIFSNADINEFAALSLSAEFIALWIDTWVVVLVLVVYACIASIGARCYHLKKSRGGL